MYLLLVFRSYETIQRVDGQPNKLKGHASCDSDLLDLRKTDFSLVMKTHWQSKGNCFENQYLDNIGITARDFKANGNNT